MLALLESVEVVDSAPNRLWESTEEFPRLGRRPQQGQTRSRLCPLVLAIQSAQSSKDLVGRRGVDRPQTPMVRLATSFREKR